MKNTIKLAALFLFVSIAAQAQNVEMADAMRQSGKIYVVVSVLLIIFLGIVAYLISIDRKINRIEKEQNK